MFSTKSKLELHTDKMAGLEYFCIWLLEHTKKTKTICSRATIEGSIIAVQFVISHKRVCSDLNYKLFVMITNIGCRFLSLSQNVQIEQSKPYWNTLPQGFHLAAMCVCVKNDLLLTVCVQKREENENQQQ